MPERRRIALARSRWWVHGQKDGPVVCPVCAEILAEPSEYPELCQHVLRLIAEPDGPEPAHPGEQRPDGSRRTNPDEWAEYERGRRDLRERPDWVRVKLQYETNPYNGVWWMVVAWPLAALGKGNVVDAVTAAVRAFELTQAEDESEESDEAGETGESGESGEAQA